MTGDDTGLVIGAAGACADTIRRQVAALTGLPAGAVQVDTGGVPRTASGKVDYDALRRRQVAAVATKRTAAGTSVAHVYATVLGREDVGPTDTFVSLGGDSLNYVECSVRLEKAIGGPPADWHLRPVAELDAIERRPGWPRLDTTALLRTVGILAIVSTHMFLWYFPGGAHLMLAVVGYNFSRFQLSIDDQRARARAVLRSIGRVAVPAVAFVAVCMLVVGGYGPTTLGLVNNYLGPPTHDDGRWHYWFIEAVVQTLIIVTAVLAVPPVHRFERRRPYLAPLLLVGLGLVLRECWIVIDGYNNLRFQTHGVAWFLLLGWLIHRSTTIRLKLATTAICLVTIPGFFGRTERELLITPRAGPARVVPRPAAPPPRRPGRRPRRRRQHGDLHHPLPRLPAPRPEPAIRPRLSRHPRRRHWHLGRRPLDHPPRRRPAEAPRHREARYRSHHRRRRRLSPDGRLIR